MDEQLAPYDENLPVPRWVLKSEVVEEGRANILACTTGAGYREWAASPDESTVDEGRAEYYKELRNQLSWSDDEVYEHELGERWNPEVDPSPEVLEFIKVNPRPEPGAVLDVRNPQAMWDWWTIGGRYASRLLLRTGERVSSARKGNIDFDGMQEAAHVEAGLRFDRVEKLVEEYGRPETFDYFLSKHNDDVAAARSEYWGQPFMRSITGDATLWLYENPVDGYCLHEDNPREAYAHSEALHSVPCYAWVEDGIWNARGKMGWFGFSDDTVSTTEWYEKVWEKLLELPDDTLVTIVDCHI